MVLKILNRLFVCLLLSLSCFNIPLISCANAQTTAATTTKTNTINTRSGSSFVLPDLGTGSNGRFIDHAPLRRMGENAWMHLQKESAWLEDPIVISYLTHLVQQLAGYSPSPVSIRGIGVLNDSSINAFAMPGGFIVIHTGLLLKVETEDELASVLAHEIAHLSQAHIDRLWETQEKSQWGVLAAVLLGIYSGSTGNIDTANALITSGIGAGTQQQVQHSQQAESEADDVGLDILTAAGFNPMGSVRMMDRLARQRTEDVNSRYSATHPLSSERVRRLRDRTLGLRSATSPDLQKTNANWLMSFSEVQSYTKEMLAQQSNPAMASNSCADWSPSKSFLATWQAAQCLLLHQPERNQGASPESLQLEQSLKTYYKNTPSFLIAQPLAQLLKQQGKLQEALKIVDQTIQIETQTGQLITQAQSWWLRAQLIDKSPTEQRIAITRSYLARLDCAAAQEQLKLINQTLPKQAKNASVETSTQIKLDLNATTQQISIQCSKSE